jgi:hypothetical protein
MRGSSPSAGAPSAETSGSLDSDMLLRRLLPACMRSLPTDEHCDADDETWLCRRRSLARAWLKRDLMLLMAASSRRLPAGRARDAVVGRA